MATLLIEQLNRDLSNSCESLKSTNYRLPITQLPDASCFVYVVAAVVPRMARLTRLRISGIL